MKQKKEAKKEPSSFSLETFKRMPRGLKFLVILDIVWFVEQLFELDEYGKSDVDNIFTTFYTFGIPVSLSTFTAFSILFSILEIIYFVAYFKRYRWAWKAMMMTGTYMVASSLFVLLKIMSIPVESFDVAIGQYGADYAHSDLWVAKMTYVILAAGIILFGGIITGYLYKIRTWFNR